MDVELGRPVENVIRLPQAAFCGWLFFLGLGVFLVIGGCSKKNVITTTTQTESQTGEVPPSGLPKPPQKRNVPEERESLRGFTVSPPEESTQPPPPTAMGAAPPGPRAVQRKALAGVQFAFNRWTLSKEARNDLAAAGEFLRRNPDTPISIEGHCDERGSHDYNLVLGLKRAEEVRRYLTRLQVTNRIRIKSFGKERPLCVEPREPCYTKNRRADVVLEESR